MKTYRDILEAQAKTKTSKQYLTQYIDNMFDNNDVVSLEFGDYRYKTWKDFFQAAKNGAYDWSEELQDDKVRDGILKIKDRAFAADKKLFKQIRAEN
jgi:hypothetical protein